jgi:hypothetical protein
MGCSEPLGWLMARARLLARAMRTVANLSGKRVILSLLGILLGRPDGISSCYVRRVAEDSFQYDSRSRTW